MDIPAAICNLVIEKNLEGLSQRQVSRDLNLSQSTVFTIISRYRKTGNASPNRMGKCGWKKTLSPRNLRVLHRTSIQNPRATARDIKSAAGDEIPEVSVSTVKRGLREMGCVSYRPVKSPSLTPAQMRVKLAWAKSRENWTVDMWRKVSHFI